MEGGNGYEMQIEGEVLKTDGFMEDIWSKRRKPCLNAG
jgi:hypothetical protein